MSRLLSLAALALACTALAHYPTCQTIKIPLNVTSTNIKVTAPAPQSQSDVIGVVGTLVSLNGGTNATMLYTSGTQSISASYQINARLCVPNEADVVSAHADTVQLLIHGIGADMTYWDNPYANFNYSYVVAAAKKGYATLAIDRLGIGGSSKPDPAQAVQTAAHTEIARQIALGLKSGSLGFSGGKRYGKVVSVGHSYGSVITNLLVKQNPGAVDAIVLTGYSHNMTGLVTFNAATQPGIANQVNSTAFGSLPNGYLLGSSVYGLQLIFFHNGNFDPDFLSYVAKTSQTVTVGEALTIGQGYVPGYDFAGPVLTITGEYDQPFCAGSCFGAGYPSIIGQEAQYWTGSRAFKPITVPNTGHFLNYHYSAQSSYAQILDFLSGNGL